MVRKTCFAYRDLTVKVTLLVSGLTSKFMVSGPGRTQGSSLKKVSHNRSFTPSKEGWNVPMCLSK